MDVLAHYVGCFLYGFSFAFVSTWIVWMLMDSYVDLLFVEQMRCFVDVDCLLYGFYYLI